MAVSAKNAPNYVNRAFRVVENIAFLVGMDVKKHQKALLIVDLNDVTKRAVFTVFQNDFVLETTSFSQKGKRWYETLYILERNRVAILKAYKGVR
jgi:hypothetical protein